MTLHPSLLLIFIACVRGVSWTTSYTREVKISRKYYQRLDRMFDNNLEYFLHLESHWVEGTRLALPTAIWTWLSLVEETGWRCIRSGKARSIKASVVFVYRCIGHWVSDCLEWKVSICLPSF